MARGVGGQSPANVQKYLSGIDYPAKKEDLLNTARNNEAPPEVEDLLKQMPEQTYGGPQEVMKAYGKIK